MIKIITIINLIVDIMKNLLSMLQFDEILLSINNLKRSLLSNLPDVSGAEPTDASLRSK